MGIIIVPIFLMAYLLACWIAIGAARGTGRKQFRWRNYYRGTGFALASVGSLYAASLVTYNNTTDVSALFAQAGIILLGPIGLAIAFTAIRSQLGARGKVVVDALTAGSLYATFFTPWMAIFVQTYSQDIIDFWNFNAACRQAQIQYLIEVEPARSVLLNPDSFIEVSARGRSRDGGELAKYLLNNSSLKSVERIVNKRGDTGTVPQYEKLTTIGPRFTHWHPETKESTQFQSRYATTSSAEYIVSPRKIAVPETTKTWIGGAIVEIHRASDHALVAYAKYYWDDKTHSTCPEDTQKGAFPYRFIVNALNVANSSTGIRGAKE